MRRSKCVVVPLCIAMMILGIAGCKGHRPTPIPRDFGEKHGPTSIDSSDPSRLPDVPLDQPYEPFEGLQKVYFDYNSAALSTGALAALKANAERIKSAPACTVRVEGHCDERGTQEYNLALGERRALAVREQLIRLGLPGSRLITLSYGKERPADPGHIEAAWKTNRRCEFSKSVSK